MNLLRAGVFLSLVVAAGCASNPAPHVRPFELASGADREPSPVLEDRASGRAQFDAGLALQQQNRLRGAADRFTAATEARPHMADAFVHRSATRREGAPVAVPGSASADRGFATRESAGRDFAREDAEQALRVVTEKRHPDAWVARGDAHRAAGDLARATADYTEALRISPHYWVALARRGLASFDAGDFRSAAADFEARLDLNPADASRAEAALRLWICRARLAGLEGATVELKARLKDLRGEAAEIAAFLVSGRAEFEGAGEPSGRAWFYVAESRLLRGDTGGAKAAFAKCTAEGDPATASARAELQRLR